MPVEKMHSINNLQARVASRKLSREPCRENGLVIQVIGLTEHMTVAWHLSPSMVCATGDPPPSAHETRRLLHAELRRRRNLEVDARSQVRSGQKHGTFPHAFATLGP